jgi:hypothetical protein
MYERLTLTRLERNENASALVGRLESHFTALAHVGEKLSEAHKKSVLITALDSSVDHREFLRSIRSNPLMVKDHQTLRDSIVEDDIRRRRHAILRSTESTEPSSAVALLTSPTCERCGKRNHLAKYCRAPKPKWAIEGVEGVADGAIEEGADDEAKDVDEVEGAGGIGTGAEGGWVNVSMMSS